MSLELGGNESVEKKHYGKDNETKIASGEKQRSDPTIGINDKLICLFDFSACVDFCVLFSFCYMDRLANSSLG